MAGPLPPPLPINGLAISGRTFFCGFLTRSNTYTKGINDISPMLYARRFREHRKKNMFFFIFFMHKDSECFKNDDSKIIG